MEKASGTKLTYCAYCKKQTPHENWSQPGNDGTGGKLTCTRYWSARVDQIQSFAAALM